MQAEKTHINRQQTSANTSGCTSRMRPLSRYISPLLLGLCVLGAASGVQASSHREAPGIAASPQVDATDFYMFRSYEMGREGYTTLIANYVPLQDPYGGPNYFPLDTDATYFIHVSNNGDVIEDVSFQFNFWQSSPFIALDVGNAGDTQSVTIPLSNAGQILPGDDSLLNVERSFTIKMVRGDIKKSEFLRGPSVTNADSGSHIFTWPFDNIGNKSIPDYAAYAEQYIYDVKIPGCTDEGRVFVGQRKDSFAVNLGETFDLINLNPLGAPDAEASDTEDKNITTLALEVPTICLTEGNGDIINGWTTARMPKVKVLNYNKLFNSGNKIGYDNLARYFGPLEQVSRLANPLVNELVIGLDNKDLFNSSSPVDDGQFLPFVTNPTLPELIEILFGDAGVQAPNNFPRNDLVWVFLTGIPGVTADNSVGEVMRLNTAIPVTPMESQNRLGVLGGDLAGYPNGRRPGDDTVDISLRAAMGAVCYAGLGVCEPADAPSGDLPYTDGAMQEASQFDITFPYLTTAVPGSPNATPMP